MGTRIAFFFLFLLSSSTWAADVTCNLNDCFRNGWSFYSVQGTNTVTCVGSDCLNMGWTQQDNFGHVNAASCKPGGCFTNGWFEAQQYYPYYSFNTYCKAGGCLISGWTTYHQSGQIVTDVTCTNMSCARFGWYMSNFQAPGSQTQCKGGDCFRYGWVVYP